jgi:hypothetical protein
MYKTINGWTKRKVLAVLKKRKYEEAAFNSATGNCEYGMKNGNRCGVGMFIPDNHKALGANMGADHLLQEYPDLKTELPFTLAGLKAIQRLHDHITNRDNAKTKMIEWVKKNVRG